MEDKLNFNLPEIKADLVVGISECNKRGLIHSGKITEIVCLQKKLNFFVFQPNGWLS